MRYQTKLLITAGLLLAMSLAAAALAYWGVTQSHSYFSRSRSPIRSSSASSSSPATASSCSRPGPTRS